jgi:hypothetical protein
MQFIQRRKFELAGTGCGLITGLILGLVIGGSLGIATGGIAIAGTIPCAAIGLILFALAGNKIGSEIDRHSGK